MGNGSEGRDVTISEAAAAATTGVLKDCEEQLLGFAQTAYPTATKVATSRARRE